MSKHIHNNKHLTSDKRKNIQTEIVNRSNKIDITRIIGKNSTIVTKKIRKHRTFKRKINFFILLFEFIKKVWRL